MTNEKVMKPAIGLVCTLLAVEFLLFILSSTAGFKSPLYLAAMDLVLAVILGGNVTLIHWDKKNIPFAIITTLIAAILNSCFSVYLTLSNHQTGIEMRDVLSDDSFFPILAGFFLISTVVIVTSIVLKTILKGKSAILYSTACALIMLVGEWIINDRIVYAVIVAAALFLTIQFVSVMCKTNNTDIKINLWAKIILSAILILAVIFANSYRASGGVEVAGKIVGGNSLLDDFLMAISLAAMLIGMILMLANRIQGIYIILFASSFLFFAYLLGLSLASISTREAMGAVPMVALMIASEATCWKIQSTYNRKG